MAIGAFDVYESGALALLNGSVDFVNDTIQARLLNASYTPDAASDETWGDISANEIVDADYSPVNLSNMAISLQSGPLIRYDSDNISFGTDVTISAAIIVIMKLQGTVANSELLFYADLDTGGGLVSSTNSDYAVSLPTNGFWKVDI